MNLKGDSKIKRSVHQLQAPAHQIQKVQVPAPKEIHPLLIQVRGDSCYELLLPELSTGLRHGEICVFQ